MIESIHNKRLISFLKSNKTMETTSIENWVKQNLLVVVNIQSDVIIRQHTSLFIHVW